MVNFIFGGAGAGKSEYIFAEIERLLRETDKKICLIVPEPYTVAAEATLARRFPSSASLRLEAVNFTRLSDNISRITGGISYTVMSKGAEMLLLWRALMSVWPSLTELNSLEGGDGIGLIPTLYSARRELTLSGVTPEQLDSAATSLDDSSLSRRAHDLALICAAMSSLEGEKFGGIDDPVRRIVDAAAESGYFNNTCVFIDSFYSLTGVQNAAISEIIRCADEVSIAIPMSSRRADGIHLDGVKRFYESALAAALRHGGEVKFVDLRGNHRARSAELATVQAHLWDYDYTPSCEEKTSLPSVPDSVSVVSVADRYDEAEALCSLVQKLVRGGAKYSDIAVACADVTKLRGICDSALRRHGIPCFISADTRITSSPAVRLILSLLKLPGRWRREDVISIVKTGLSPISDNLACTFESYTDTWNIRGARAFTSPWSMNPDGYREEISERAKKILLDANEARDALVPHLEEFVSVFDGGEAKVSDICTRIVEFFEHSGAYEKLQRRADRLASSGAADDAARERLVWQEICTALDTVVSLLGELGVDAAGFATLFRYAISDADTGAIPTGVDVVTIAGASTLRTDGVKHMIILGAVEGEFPAVPEDLGYFSDAECERLAQAGVVIGTRTGERVSEEMFRFYRVVAQASHTLCVFVPQMSDGARVSISEGGARILSLLGRDGVEPYCRDVYDRESLDAACAKGDVPELLEIRREMFGELERKTFERAEDLSVSRQTAQEIFTSHVRLSQSRIDAYVKCPMAYYCRYVLKLSEDRRAEITSPDIGTFVHAVLEELLKQICASGTYPEGEELEELCDGIISAYIKRTCGEITDGRMAYLFRRLKRQVNVFAEAIVAEASQSRFSTYRTELPVGMGGPEGSPPPVVFSLEGGGEVSLIGKIDRMDVYKKDGKSYIRVIDYKTGRTSFSYDDVKLGLNVQLLLYLFSAWKAENSAFHRELDGGEHSELVPAGALYFNLRPGESVSDYPLTREEARELVLSSMDRSGIVTDDRDVLDAMDRGITGKYVPVSLNADGSYRRSASLATLERFGELYREMESVICRIAAEMKSGCAAARPLERHESIPCDYCKMRGVCRRNTKEG